MVSVTLLLWFLSRLVPIRFGATLLHQALSLAVMGIFAFVCVKGGRHVATGILVVDFLVQGIAYTLLTSLAVVAWPKLFGLTRVDLARICNVARRLAARFGGK